jgi:MarR family transcriptional regulator, 2-MHQ and catechol-resistance regulon repressor
MPSHYRGAEKEVRALNAYITLFRAADTLAGRSSARLNAIGLTIGQFGVLEALLHLGPLCQHALGEKLLCTGGNITLLVDNLEKRGLVRRTRDTVDRRFITVQLTPKGRKRIRRIFPSHAAAIAREMEPLSRADLVALRRICRKLGRGIAENLNREAIHDPSSTE